VLPYMIEQGEKTAKDSTGRFNKGELRVGKPEAWNSAP